MKMPRAILLTAAFVSGAQACDTSSPEPCNVHGVELASICAACGVVSDSRVETRTGQATGLGAVGGGVVGGVLGNQIGGGSGRAVATVLGAVGGGFAGNTIEKNVRKVTIWSTTVTFRDGSTQTYEQTSDPVLDKGYVVKIDHGRPVRYAW